ncbi:MAG: hypothetical protein HC802_07285 [Caldilineaceae bacterium]|nr:hypothetical protein [Caldilineaceae bacterium]
MRNEIIEVLVRSWWGIAAIVGGGCWAVKSLAILTTGDQPDYLFELAPIALATATLGLVLTWHREYRSSRLPVGLGAVALVSASLASVSYIVQGDDEGLFGLTLMIAMLSIIALLFWVGRPLWRTREGEQWRAIPYPLGWAFIVAMPLGGLLSALNERLLEIPLLAISIGWIWLGIAWIATTSHVKG